MQYEILFEHAEYSLIKRKSDTKYPEYAVVRGLDKTVPMDGDCWAATVMYLPATPAGLTTILDCYRGYTENKYMSRARLSELATLFKDGLFEDGHAEAMEYCKETCGLEDYEMEYLGIEDEDNDEEVA